MTFSFFFCFVFKNSQAQSGNSPSITDGEFSSSFLSGPYNGISSSTSDLDRSHNQQHQNLSSSTVSALTTLTRKSTPKRQSTKNVSFQPSQPLSINSTNTNNIFNDLFSNTSSTFSTLPKQLKHDIIIPIKNANSSTTLPQPPPLLNGIILLDKMLTKTSEEKSSTNNNNWYNITSNYQTRASIV